MYDKNQQKLSILQYFQKQNHRFNVRIKLLYNGKVLLVNETIKLKLKNKRSLSLINFEFYL